MNTRLENLHAFFEQDIFDVDEDKVEGFLCQYDIAEIFNALIIYLEFSALSKNDIKDTSWRLGRVFGAVKCFSVDERVIEKIPSSTDIMSVACFNFLSGYWDEAQPSFQAMQVLLRNTAIALANKSWTQDMLHSSAEALGGALINNKQFLNDELFDVASFKIIRDFSVGQNKNSVISGLFLSI